MRKLVGMLGSDSEGERANALRFITKLAESYKMHVHEAIAAAMTGVAPQPDPQPSPQARPQPQQDRWWRPPPDPQPPPDEPTFEKIGVLGDLQRAVTCQALNAWERSFADDVSRRYESDSQLSDKQVLAARKILDKVDAFKRRTGGI